MDTTNLFSALLSTQNPVLPQPLVFRLYLGLAWGAVLAALALVLLAHRGVTRWGVHRWLPPLLLLWCLLPGALSPAYWLGLALRAPSGLLLMLCAWSLLRHVRPQTPGIGPVQAMRPWAVAFALLGWVLLLDTLAFWPVSLYAWGYAPLTLGGLVLLGLLPSLLRGHHTLSALWIGAVLLHGVLRLPTGNVWDAVLDPALWLWLQVDGLRRLTRRA